MSAPYSVTASSREEVDQLQEPVILEFGTDWCGFCQAAQPVIAAGLSARPGVKHLKIEDGPGRALGRSFRVKLWPTLIFMVSGKEVARVVRPNEAAEVSEALKALG